LSEVRPHLPVERRFQQHRCTADDHVWQKVGLSLLVAGTLRVSLGAEKVRTAVLLLCLLLPACTPQIVKVPIYKRAAPPAELSEWHPGRLPLWIPPIDTATSCLTPEGEQLLRALLLDMKTRIRAWEAWGKEEP
jgi:hypothetical protein